jgi:hypothetical protein
MYSALRICIVGSLAGSIALVLSAMADAGTTGFAHSRTVDGGAPATWHFDGGILRDGGVTDVLTLAVGQAVLVSFPLPIAFGQCDAPLVTVSPEGDRLRFEARQPGTTHCGYWFQKGALPQRLVLIEVRTATPEATPAPQRPWWSPARQ